jgi:hypothetical protein
MSNVLGPVKVIDSATGRAASTTVKVIEVSTKTSDTSKVYSVELSKIPALVNVKTTVLPSASTAALSIVAPSIV